MIEQLLIFLNNLFSLFKKDVTPSVTSERIEEESEETGDLTMIADKMLERLHKRRKK